MLSLTQHACTSKAISLAAVGKTFLVLPTHCLLVVSIFYCAGHCFCPAIGLFFFFFFFFIANPSLAVLFQQSRWCVPGAVGYMGTSAFVRKIYTNVKIDWQTLQQQRGYKVDLPVWRRAQVILYFSFLQRDWESRFVLCRFTAPLSPPSIFWMNQNAATLKRTTAKIHRRGLNTQGSGFYQLLFLTQRWGKCFKADMASLLPPSPTRDKWTEMFIEGTV